MNAPARLGDRVTLHYRLDCAGETVADTFTGEPESFVLGAGDIDARLEALLLGLRASDHRVFELAPGEAFGLSDPAMIHTLARAEFPTDMTLAPGNEIEFTLPNGQTLTGIARDLDADTVRVDFNHPLAGLAVRFEVAVLAVEQEHA